MNNQTFDPTEAAKAQDSYCTQHEVPMFAPSDGICYHCGRNIYDPITYRGREDHTYGISVEEAGKRLISSCPHCNYSFVE